MGPSEAEDGRDDAIDVKRFDVHWAVFLPTAAIALLYTVLWLWFTEAHGASGGVSRAALLVLAMGVPLLMVHAGLRYVNGCLELGQDELIIRPGGPVRRERCVAYADIAELTVKRGLIGRVVDVGTLVITDRNGGRAVMTDLAGPADAGQTIRTLSGLSVTCPSPSPA